MTYDLLFAATTEDGTRLGSVYLRHEPVDADKIVRLREKMTVNGWQGRKVVLLACGDHHMALNGVHRLCAAQGIDDLVEVAWLPEDLTAEEFALIDAANDDDDLLEAFTAIAEGRGDNTMDEVIETMKAEVEANNE